MQGNSQNTLIKQQRVKTVVNAAGDTLIQMSIDDAKIVLTDIINKNICDSLLCVYENRDSINKQIIQVQATQITLIKQKVMNCEEIVSNMNKILENKDAEIALLNETIKKQKREIRKQKTLKFLGIGGAIILPAVTLGVLLGIK